MIARQPLKTDVAPIVATEQTQEVYLEFFQCFDSFNFCAALILTLHNIWTQSLIKNGSSSSCFVDWSLSSLGDGTAGSLEL